MFSLSPVAFSNAGASSLGAEVSATDVSTLMSAARTAVPGRPKPATAAAAMHKINPCLIMGFSAAGPTRIRNNAAGRDKEAFPGRAAARSGAAQTRGPGVARSCGSRISGAPFRFAPRCAASGTRAGWLPARLTRCLEGLRLGVFLRRRRGLALHRQAHQHDRAHPLGRADARRAAVQVDERLRDREPESRALVALGELALDLLE